MKFRLCPVCGVVLVGDDQYRCRPCAEQETAKALHEFAVCRWQDVETLRTALTKALANNRPSN